MPTLREERERMAVPLPRLCLKGRIKHFSEPAATQSEPSDGKRLRRGGVTGLTGAEGATKGAGKTPGGEEGGKEANGCHGRTDGASSVGGNGGGRFKKRDSN